MLKGLSNAKHLTKDHCLYVTCCLYIYVPSQQTNLYRIWKRFVQATNCWLGRGKEDSTEFMFLMKYDFAIKSVQVQKRFLLLFFVYFLF